MPRLPDGRYESGAMQPDMEYVEERHPRPAGAQDTPERATAAALGLARGAAELLRHALELTALERVDHDLDYALAHLDAAVDAMTGEEVPS